MSSAVEAQSARWSEATRTITITGTNNRDEVQVRTWFGIWIVVTINGRYFPVLRNGSAVAVNDPVQITIGTGGGNDDVHLAYLLGMGPQFQGTRTYLGDGNDTMSGSNYDDFCDCGDGHDDVDMGHGNDRVFGRNGDDRLGGGVGVDYLDGGAGWDCAWGREGEDTFVNVECINPL